MARKLSNHLKSKSSKPKLPKSYRQLLEQGDYSIRVEILLGASTDNSAARTIGHSLNGKIQVNFFDDASDEVESVEIGSILGWQVYNVSIDDVVLWADSISQGVQNAFAWLADQPYEDPDDALSMQVLFIDEVKIDPMWRGQGLTLPAVATYIDLSCCNFVFFIPMPPCSRDMSQQEQRRTARLLQKYWSRLGFDHYDSDYGIMWTPYWSCPEWLQGNDDCDSETE